MRVSVILPTYQRLAEFERSLQSLFNQSHDDVEIVVVDDNGLGSETQIKIAKICQAWPDVRYLAVEKNLGGGLARDYGVRHCTGEYITFLDDDDHYLPNKVARQLEFMLQHSLDICVCEMQIQNADGAEQLYSSFHERAVASSREEFLFKGVAFTPMIMLKKSVYLASQGFIDTPCFQDHIMVLNVLRVTDNIGVLPEKLFVHHQGPTLRISHSAKRLRGYLLRFSVERKVCIENNLDIDQLKFNQSLILADTLMQRKSLCGYSQFCLALLKRQHDLRSIKRVARKLVKYLLIRVGLLTQK